MFVFSFLAWIVDRLLEALQQAAAFLLILRLGDLPDALAVLRSLGTSCRTAAGDGTMRSGDLAIATLEWEESGVVRGDALVDNHLCHPRIAGGEVLQQGEALASTQLGLVSLPPLDLVLHPLTKQSLPRLIHTPKPPFEVEFGPAGVLFFLRGTFFFFGLRRSLYGSFGLRARN